MAETKNTPGADGNTTPQPGTVIAPGATPPAPETSEPPAPVPAPEPSPEAPEPTEQPQPADPAPPEDASPGDGGDQSVAWTASEFVAHDKSAGWYALLAMAGLLLAALIFVLTRDVVSVAVVITAGLLLGVYGAHKPRQLEYRIDGRGVGIGQKYYGYHEFKSFSVVPEGAFASIVFMPLKRFAVPTTIYYAPDDEEKILAVLSNQLPFEEHRRDAVDGLMRRIRF